jgi:hypothetical protein
MIGILTAKSTKEAEIAELKYLGLDGQLLVKMRRFWEMLPTDV